MPLTKSSSKEAFSNNVSEMMHAGHPQKQALAAAYATQRKAEGRALGGVAPMLGQAYNPTGMPMGSGMPTGAPPAGIAPSPAMMPQMGLNAPMPGPGGARGFADGGGVAPIQKTFKGPIISAVPGRTDNHFTHVPSGSYVIPADIVSGHGQGNTLAGMDSLHKLFKMGTNNAMSTRLPFGGNHMAKGSKFSKGGAEHHMGKPVPVKLAGGEIVVSPEHVIETMSRICKKKMTLDECHRAMDKWVVNERKKLRKTLAKLPGPAKD